MDIADLKKIDKSWTLFLDRDGVINYEKQMDYIRNWNEFKFYERVPEAMAIFAEKFGRILVVTNQKGIGKKLMTDTDLESIHEGMVKEVEAAGGRIDHILYCPALDDEHPSRKPNPGMAHDAQKLFPEINLKKSIMVGNKHSDMLFGRNAGMHTVYLTTTHPDQPFPHIDIDMTFPTLMNFAKAL